MLTAELEFRCQIPYPWSAFPTVKCDLENQQTERVVKRWIPSEQRVVFKSSRNTIWSVGQDSDLEGSKKHAKRNKSALEHKKDKALGRTLIKQYLRKN